MQVTRIGGTIALAAAVLAMAGCAGTSSTTTAPATRVAAQRVPQPPPFENAMCPISGLPAQPDVPVVNYEGHRIGFCCKACKTPWDLMSDDQKRDLVANVLPAQRQATRRRAYQRWSPRR